ncbi:hypothetical protein NDU88_002624 [Pleurodeles waltl]|uniref:Uncharacterized protein n=1 Tax=Pleurodeles waltl TaxID=8319 RepID=A0AAV7VB25_PLEWA|nr:hypothetical protein NDU88_002624 [Pleurodeles waltl]
MACFHRLCPSRGPGVLEKARSRSHPQAHCAAEMMRERRRRENSGLQLPPCQAPPRLPGPSRRVTGQA